MKAEIDYGGPAFPVFARGSGDADWGGMSLRAYFAANAPELERWFKEPNDKYLARIVTWSYQYADAMIAKIRDDRT